MSDIFGQPATGVRERTGSLAQVVRVDDLVQQQGSARGSRMLRLVNGGGLEIEVHPDRALDLGRVTVDGIPVSWISSPGITSPEFYEPEGTGWLRTFGGGLLATCGLDAFGPPSSDDGTDYGMHGRIGTVPAVVTRAEATDEGVIVEGTARQTSVFGENLVLRRRISSAAGSDTVTVEDTVTNEGFARVSHMVLYHANLGWPLLDEDAVIDVPSEVVTPRDADAEAGASDWCSFNPPTPGFREQVYRHDFTGECEVLARVTNHRLGVEFTLGFTSAELPHLYQWKMSNRGHYVLGLEPSNSVNVFGRTAAKDADELRYLEPGASAHYRLDFCLRRITSTSTREGTA